jgi:hypothetical protein
MRTSREHARRLAGRRPVACWKSHSGAWLGLGSRLETARRRLATAGIRLASSWRRLVAGWRRGGDAQLGEQLLHPSVDLDPAHDAFRLVRGNDVGLVLGIRLAMPRLFSILSAWSGHGCQIACRE